MSNDLNRCQFIGRLGRDVETKYIPDGTAISNFVLAVGWKTKEKEGTEWVRVQAWGRLGEICGEYLNKGSLVYIEGRMQTRSWEDRDGNKRYTTEVVASKMQMLDTRRNDEAGEIVNEPEPVIPDDNIPF